MYLMDVLIEDVHTQKLSLVIFGQKGIETLKSTSSQSSIAKTLSVKNVTFKKLCMYLCTSVLGMYLDT